MAALPGISTKVLVSRLAAALGVACLLGTVAAGAWHGRWTDAGLGAGVVLVASDMASVQSVVEARADVKALGLEVGRVVTLPTARAAVA